MEFNFTFFVFFFLLNYLNNLLIIIILLYNIKRCLKFIKDIFIKAYISIDLNNICVMLPLEKNVAGPLAKVYFSYNRNAIIAQKQRFGLCIIAGL